MPPEPFGDVRAGGRVVPPGAPLLLLRFAGRRGVFSERLPVCHPESLGGMKGVVETVAGVVERLSLSSAEKKRLQQELEMKLLEYEHERMAAQSVVVREESGGNWLQRSWRPLVMLAFAAVILAGMFIDLPLLSDGSRFWDLLEIGLGGYIVGRFRWRK